MRAVPPPQRRRMNQRQLPESEQIRYPSVRDETMNEMEMGVRLQGPPKLSALKNLRFSTNRRRMRK